MIKRVLGLLLVGFLLWGFCPGMTFAKGLIPYPAKMTQSEGVFLFTPQTKIVCDKALASFYPFYKEILEAKSGFQLAEKGKGTNRLLLKVDKTLNLPLEGYKLSVTSNEVTIEASSSKGIFYGLQSMFQLMEHKETPNTVAIPLVDIEDAPRFGWRGIMLDVSRTFMSVPLVKRYIDLMAAYKLNVLHLHLTDDQGWRVEIKKYPRLTSIGSKFDPEFNEMGGYYTQEDIKDLVKYASLRNITIVPEIDLPGHTCAVIASYPDLSCRSVRPQIHPHVKGPSVHQEILCAGKPEVYEFIYGVLDELVELFPSEYIHIGGDEAPKNEWKKCPYCQQAIKANGLKNEEELQSHFVKELGLYLASKNRKLVGWDEIMDGGKLKGDEVIMYWRGWIKNQILDYAKRDFKVVTSPTSHCYFDYSYSTIDTKRVYSFEPIPAEIPADKRDNYIGVQANFWSHLDRSESRIDRQLFPRLFALAEIAWTSPENKDWERFKSCAKAQNEYLRTEGVNGYFDDCLYYPD